MTKETIVESNVLIAKFMGYEYVPNNGCNTPGFWNSTSTEETRSLNYTIAKKLTSTAYLARHHRDLLYFNSWDWLMPVVAKIEDTKMAHHKTGPFSVNMYLKCCNIEYDIQHAVAFPEIPFRDISYEEDTKLLSTYKAIVYFIEWYNKNWIGKVLTEIDNGG